MAPSAAGVGLFTTDKHLVIQSWDAWLVRATGIAAEAVCARPLTAVLPDLERRGLLARFERVLADGVVEVLAPGLHGYLIPCPPPAGTRTFDRMQQRVTIAPLSQDGAIIGTLVTIEDVTLRREWEREQSRALASAEPSARLHAAHALAEDDEARPQLIHALGDASWQVRQAAAGGLGQRASAEIIAALVQTVRAQHHDLSVLNSALAALGLAGDEATAPLLELLELPDPDLRCYVAQVLGERSDRRAIAALAALLQDADTNVRYHATEALGKLGATEAVGALADAALAGDPFLAFAALDALVRIGDPAAAERVLPLLDDPFLAAPAAELLGLLGDLPAALPLSAALNAPDAPISALAGALAAIYRRCEADVDDCTQIGEWVRQSLSGAGAQKLLAALDSADDDDLEALALVASWLDSAADLALVRLLSRSPVRSTVVEALVQRGVRVTDPLLAQLDAGDEPTRVASAVALGRIGSRRAAPALTKLLGGSADEAVAAAGALAKIGDHGPFEPLLALLGHPAAAVRQAAIGALNSLGHPAMAARVSALLSDTDPHLRESAALIAGYFGYPSCGAALIVCCGDPDERVRRAAVEHLPFVDDPQAEPALETALRGGTPPVRAAAARAMAHVEAARALPLLYTALTDADMWVRYYAAQALGRHGCAEATGALARAAEDPAAPVRLAALAALGQIGGAEAVAVLAPQAGADDADLARVALRALGQASHPDARAPLLAALGHQGADRRLEAVGALAGHRDGATVAALRQRALTDADAGVQLAAVQTLRRIGTDDAAAALVELTAEPRLRRAATVALGQLHDGTLAALARGLRDPRAVVRCAVVAALARIRRPAASRLIAVALDDNDADVRRAASAALERLGSREAHAEPH